jgi:hypothetical protein
MGWEADGSDGGGQGWYDLCMAIDPNNANNIYVGGVNVWKSTDGGSTWTIAGHWYGQNGNPEIHADHHDLSFQPGTNTLFSTNDGGIYSYNGSAWADRTNGMAISQMYRVSASQATTKIISGLQDNGTKLRSVTGTWTDVFGGDGMECGIDPSDPNYMYSTIYNGKLFRSSDGSTFNESITPDNSSGEWISPFVMDPITPSTIYLGHKVLWKSTDRGTHWTNISAGTTGVGGFYSINNIAVAPSNNSVIYITWLRKISRTSNGGGSWMGDILPPSRWILPMPMWSI